MQSSRIIFYKVLTTHFFQTLFPLCIQNSHARKETIFMSESITSFSYYARRLNGFHFDKIHDISFPREKARIHILNNNLQFRSHTALWTTLVSNRKYWLSPSIFYARREWLSNPRISPSKNRKKERHNQGLQVPI